MSTTPAKHSRHLWVVLIVLLVSATVTQVVLEGRLQNPPVRPGVHWIQSPGLMRRLAVGFNAIWADIYWIRAVQYDGDTKLSADVNKNYDQLYPLLDTTTSLDPRFNIAYRFGSILLSEGFPNGPGQTERRSRCFRRASAKRRTSGSTTMTLASSSTGGAGTRRPQPSWFMKALEAAELAELAGAARGERVGARAANARRPAQVWLQLIRTADHEWIRQAATVDCCSSRPKPTSSSSSRWCTSSST